MKHQCLILQVVFLASILACSTTPGPQKTFFEVDVSSLLDPAAASMKSYTLFPGVEGVTDTDLQYREFARYVRKALAEHGFVEVEEPTAAQIAIFMNYGIGEPETTYYSYSYPVFGMTGGGTSTISSSTFGSGGYSSTTGTISQSPRIGVTGIGTAIGSRTTYLRYLVLEAIDVASLRDNRKVVPTWKTIVSSSGSSGDLRRVMPVLVAAAQPHIASDTGHKVAVRVEETDPSVLSIKAME